MTRPGPAGWGGKADGATVEFLNLTYSLQDRVAEIALARADRRNALSPALRTELGQALDRAAGDPRVGAVVIAGEEECFCAGADIREVSAFEDAASVHRFSREINALFNQIEELEKPVLAAVSGAALGGGCELCLACDLRIAADNALFGLPEITIGVMPGGGGTQRLPRLIGMGRAKELIYGGEPIDAREALRIGLVNRVAETPLLRAEARKWAQRLAERPAAAFRAIKSSLGRGFSLGLGPGLAYEARCFELLFTTADSAEGLNAFLERRKPRFKGE